MGSGERAPSRPTAAVTDTGISEPLVAWQNAAHLRFPTAVQWLAWAVQDRNPPIQGGRSVAKAGSRYHEEFA